MGKKCLVFEWMAFNNENGDEAKNAFIYFGMFVSLFVDIIEKPELCIR